MTGLTRLNLHHAIMALTEALDFVGVDEVHHGKRVALMAESIARELGWSERECTFVLQAGMLHDCGVSQTREHKHLTDSLEWDGAIEHCLRGERYLSDCGPLHGFAAAIRWHHTRWEHLPPELDERTRKFANLIFLADRVDVLQCPHITGEAERRGEILWEYPAIIERVRSLSGSLFAPELVEAFAAAASAEAFWLAQDPRYFLEDLGGRAAAVPGVTLNAPEVLSMARLFSHVVDAKSAYTQDHSLRVSRIARYLAEKAGCTGETLDLVETAGLLHDLGKLRVPDEIIEKPAPLTREERALVTRHAYDTFRILNRVFADCPIPYWAGSHHENLLGTGYPFHRPGKALDLEARVISVADIFQALSQERPYRGQWSKDRVYSHLQSLVAQEKVDAHVVALLGDELDACYALATA